MKLLGSTEVIGYLEKANINHKFTWRGVNEPKVIEFANKTGKEISLTFKRALHGGHDIAEFKMIDPKTNESTVKYFDYPACDKKTITTVICPQERGVKQTKAEYHYGKDNKLLKVDKEFDEHIAIPNQNYGYISKKGKSSIDFDS